MQADIHFYGFGPEFSKLTAQKLYEESAKYGNQKAMLALASIYEKGLVNENMKNGGLLNMGAVEKTCGEPDKVKAFPYYN